MFINQEMLNKLWYNYTIVTFQLKKNSGPSSRSRGHCIPLLRMSPVPGYGSRKVFTLQTGGAEGKGETPAPKS